jgi:hypothetical protein
MSGPPSAPALQTNQIVDLDFARMSLCQQTEKKERAFGPLNA